MRLSKLSHPALAAARSVAAGLTFLCVLLLALYQILRVLFIALNASAFAEVSRSHFAQACLQGLRFDFSAICLLNCAFLLCVSLPLSPQVKNSRMFKKICAAFFLVPNIALLYLNMADVEYFKFTGKRSTLALLQMAQDIRDQAFQLLVNFWHVPIVVACLSVILYSAYQFVVRRFFVPAWQSRSSGLIAISIAAPCLVLGIRGGLQSKPLSTAHAQIFDSKNLNMATLNSTFTFLHSSTRGEVPQTNYFQNWTDVVAKLQVPAHVSGVLGPHTNVVIIILESFSLEYMGGGGRPGFTPFLSSLAKKGMFFENNFANGRRSIDAVTSIAQGLPALMEEPFVSSPYQNDNVSGLAAVLNSHGYSSAFYHGGKNGTMYFDVSARMAGFENYFGLSEYPNRSRDYDGTWGIFDEPYLQYCVQKFGEQKAPFLATVFTLSSHNPYALPAGYENKFQKGKLPILQSVQYADFALQRFFESASKEPWYGQTLFIVTGDHTSVSSEAAFQNDLGSYRVPLVFFHPTTQLPAANPQKPTQHADILPSILDLLGIEVQSRLLFGHSVFDPHFEGRAANFSGGTWWLVEGSQFLKQVQETQFLHGKVPLAGEPLVPAGPNVFPPQNMVELLHATIQYFNQGLRENKVMVPK